MKKAMFITVVDMYDKNGNGGVKGSQRNYELVERIYGKENTVLVTFPRKEYTNPPSDAVIFNRTQNNFQHLIAAVLGCKVYFPWNEKKIFNYINNENIDLLFIDSSMLGRMARIKGNYQKVVFFHNVEANYAKNKVKNEGIKFLPSYWASKLNERLAMRYADKIICLNSRDELELEKLYGRKADYILPVTMTDRFSENKNVENPNGNLLFVGAYMPQNIYSIEWFIENVMSKLENVTLDIVGKGFEAKREVYESKGNINVIGTVDDLDVQYYSHSTVVLPIQYGAGMKIKTVEAMMYGKKIIASDEALEGYDVDEVKDIYRCNKPDEYVTAIYSTLKEDNLYSDSVRDLYLKRYETNIVEEGVRNFLENGK